MQKLACYQTYRDESCNSLHRNFKMGNRNTEDSFEEVSFHPKISAYNFKLVKNELLYTHYT